MQDNILTRQLVNPLPPKTTTNYLYMNISRKRLGVMLKV